MLHHPDVTGEEELSDALSRPTKNLSAPSPMTSSVANTSMNG